MGFPIFSKIDDINDGSYQDSHLQLSLHPCVNQTLTRVLQLALTIPSDPASAFIPNNTDPATNGTNATSPESGDGEQTVQPDAGAGGDSAEGVQSEPTPLHNSTVMADAEYIVCAP